MKSRAIVRIIIWSLIAVLLTALMCGIIAVYTYNRGKEQVFDNGFSIGISGEHYAHNDSYTVGNGVISAPIHMLDIHWNAGSVHILPYDGDTVVIEETAVAEADDRMRYLVQDGRLTIYFRKSGWHIGITKNHRKDLTVKLPYETAAALTGCTVTTASADIVAEHITVNKKLKIETVSGETTLRNVVAEMLDIEGTSGLMTLTDITAYTVSLETVSGDIRAAGAFSSLSLEGVSADLQVTSHLPLLRFDGETVSGDIALTMPDPTGFILEWETTGGHLHSDFPVQARGEKRIYGDGSAKYDAETVSGDISIYRLAANTQT